MMHPGFEAADRAIAAWENELDRRVGASARKGLWNLIGLALFATPLVWAIAGCTFTGPALSGLAIGLGLYAVILWLKEIVRPRA